MIRKTLAWVVGVVVLLWPGTAHATTVWNPASCAVGTFDPVTVDAAGHYLVPAHMALCGPYQPGFTYAIVLFRGNGAVPLATGDKLLSYATPTVTADVLPPTPAPPFGLCLMRDVNTRVTCARVDTGPDGSASSAPLATTDALVADPVVFLRGPIVIHPNYCASCVTLNW